MPGSSELSPDKRALLTAGAFAAGPAVVLGVALGFGTGWLFGLVAFVVAGGLGLVYALRGGDRAVLAGLSWSKADPVAQARLCNLVEGLCTAAGVRQPQLVVVDTASLNAMAAGSAPAKTVLAVTSGLLSELERVELEGVLAEEIFLIRHHETRPATVLAATFGLGRGLALAAEQGGRADRGAVSLTRYPPALASALEKIQTKGSEVPGVSRRTEHLWLAAPRPADPGRDPRLPLHDRIEALREL